MTGQHAAALGGKDACIDCGQIDGLVEAAGVDGALEILAAFWRSTDSLLGSLKTQLTANDQTEASRTAHAIKGSALNVGATRLSDAIRAIEECCRRSDTAAALALLVEAERQYALTIAAFDAHLASAK